MASLKKVKIVDPNERVNLSLRESTRIALEQYRRFAEKAHEVPYAASEIVDQILVAWFDQDGDYQRYVKGLKAAELDDIKRAVVKDAKEDKPEEAKATPAPTSYGQAPAPVRGFGQA
ncbi:hypothetical protein [Cupriavidus taiwanensis]|uniref:hypothetical protein n=1 Tax=Cupriavidus taiwanensis TaxID=164546 RepID=UPI000E109E0F|nr:hypothetical protein [Cupriavidus taiwanensis]SOY48532.1 hypothetical protein CBM2592_A190038 [Cupriavidus taiwanensis]SOY83062.1 hypothetical protein CBM2591_A230040 [Cupriavidus taiwanensis]SOZ56264.1 hypothetical protein CBM2617_A200046 [Cupriavidus taiwanensis]SOZ78833.1 hypothetical protein CBM2618_A180048 [Cupriavidus taiwanensis]SOZ79109.1 hypothetical protein CBM2622_A170046 [Cupriavidus taiwanensis]